MKYQGTCSLWYGFLSLSIREVEESFLFAVKGVVRRSVRKEEGGCGLVHIFNCGTIQIERGQ